jgi:hypothetical protein
LALMNSAATFSDNLFDRAALDERLNAMIDRATKRLIQIKAMKQMLGNAPTKPNAEVIKLPARKLSGVKNPVVAINRTLGAKREHIG